MAILTTEHYYTGNASTTSFAYTFPYYKTSDIKVTWDGVAKTEGSHYNVTGTNIVFTSGNVPANNVVIHIYRDTDVSTSKATFAAGSSIRATDLNNNELQLLYSAQEEQDQLIQTADIKDGVITSAKILDGTIATADIADNAITSAKIQASGIGTSDIADNAVTTAKIADNAITMAKLGAGELPNDVTISTNNFGTGTITATNLASNAVTTVKILDANVTDAKLAANAVTTAKVADDAITTAKIATGAITSDSIATGTIATADIGDAVVTTAKLGADAVTSAKIADEAVTADHIAAGAVGASEIAANAVGASELADNAVDTASITADAVTSAKIADDAIGTDQIADDAVTTAKLADAELTTLAGMPSGTASVLASSTALTSTTAELNLLDGKSVVTSVSGSSTDVQLPTAKAVNDAIAGINTDAGNFVPIADELKFPNTNPDPGGNAGTIVSIADAGGIVVNGSGVSTTGRTLGGSTVTINGIDSSLNNTTIAAGKGMLVQTTSTLNTYDYHRLVVDEAGVATAQTLVNDFNSRYQVASSAPSAQVDGSALQDGDLWFDTTANEMKVYDLGNTTYSVVSSVGNFFISTLSSYSGTGGNSASFNGSAYRFVLSNVPSNAQQLIVSVNGVIQKPNSGTSQPSEGFAVDGSSILFSSAPASGSDYFVIHIGASVNIGTPSNNSVTTAILQNASVTTDKLGADAVTSAKIADDAIGAEHIADNAIVNAALADDAVGIAELSATGTAGNTTFLRGDNSWQVVDTTIADDSIAEVKLDISNTASDGQYLQYKDSTDKLTWASPAQYTTPLSARGDILFRDASGDQRLPKGTAGQYLKIGANDPEWADVIGAVAGGCIYENDQTISADHTIASGKGAHSVGPITVNATVTVNGNWVVS